MGSPDNGGSFVMGKRESAATLFLCILNEFTMETISKKKKNINCYILRTHNDSRNKTCPRQTDMLQ